MKWNRIKQNLIFWSIMLVAFAVVAAVWIAIEVWQHTVIVVQP